MHLGQEAADSGLLVERQETRPVDPGNDGLNRARPRIRGDSGEQVGDTGQRVSRGQCLHAPLGQPCPGLLIGHPGRPGTEVDRDARYTAIAHRASQAIEVGVGGTVGGLSETAPHRGDRGGAEKEVELQVSDLLAQIPCTPDFSGENLVDFNVVEVADHGVAHHTCGVYDTGQWWKFGAHSGDQPTHLLGVADVGGDHPNPAVMVGDNRVDLVLHRLAGFTAAGQHQGSGAVGGQVAGKFQTDRAQSAGDQVGRSGAQSRRCRNRAQDASHEPRHIGGAPAQRDLVFAARLRCRGNHGAHLRPIGVATGVQIDQSAPKPGVLQGCGAAKSPHTTLFRCHRIGLVDPLRGTGQHPDSGAQVRIRGGSQEPPQPNHGVPLHPRQCLSRGRSGRVEGSHVEDDQRRVGVDGGPQIVAESLLVGV